MLIWVLPTKSNKIHCIVVPWLRESKKRHYEWYFPCQFSPFLGQKEKRKIKKKVGSSFLYVLIWVWGLLLLAFITLFALPLEALLLVVGVAGSSCKSLSHHQQWSGQIGKAITNHESHEPQNLIILLLFFHPPHPWSSIYFFTPTMSLIGPSF